jgi:HEAT repeat protein
MAQVYVSSTFLDLKECREKVRLVLRKMGHEDMAMEYYAAEDQRPVEKCLSDVARCDLYIGIFAWRYGYVPSEVNPDDLSITEMEYRQAQKTGKKCLIFLLSETAPWPPKDIDRDRTRIERLREELGQKHGTGSPFMSADELAGFVAAAVHKWEVEYGQLSPSVSASDDFNWQPYYSALLKRYPRLDLDALTPPQREEYLQLQLASIFVEQNVREDPPPMELPKEVWDKLQHDEEIHDEDLPVGLTLDELLLARESYYEKSPIPVLDALTKKENKHSILLGDPGSGKSTLARYILLSLIDEQNDNKLCALGNYLPLLIELRNYAALRAERKCETFLEFINYMDRTEGWGLDVAALQRYLQTCGRAVVVFDGLDEIFDPEEREQITRQIVGFSCLYPEAQLIITSRIIGYRRKILLDAGFKHFTLQDFQEQQIAEFVDKWYSLVLDERPEDAKARGERIMRSLRESPSMRQLTGNPMLLTIMAIIGKNQELPRERWKLYEHAAGVLIQHWDVNKHLKDKHLDAGFIGEDEKKELLRRLAYKMQGGEDSLRGNYIHRELLQTEFENYLKERYSQSPDRAVIIARAMIDQFRERNFILSLYGAGLYGFVHRAFLEYFCATAIVNKFEKTQEMTLDELRYDIYGLHWDDQNWHEVLRLICGMVDVKFASEIINFLVNEAYTGKPRSLKSEQPWEIALSVQCLSETKNLSVVSTYAEQLLKKVCALIDRYAVAISGGIIPYQLPEFLRKQIMNPAEEIGPNWPNRSALADWLQGHGSFVHADFLAEATGNFIGLIGKQDEAIHKIILNFAKHQEDNHRILVPYALAMGWHDDAQTLPVLYELATADMSSKIRLAAIRILSTHFSHDPQLLPVLYERESNEKAIYVRIEIIKAIAKDFIDAPQTLPLLRERAFNDGEDEVRRLAIRVLTIHFKDDEQTLQLLCKQAVDSKHRNLRNLALNALLRIYKDSLQVRSILYNYLIKGGVANIRHTAFKLLVQHSPDYIYALPRLLDLASNSQHIDVRRLAVGSLITNIQTYPDELALKALLELAKDEKDKFILSRVISALGKSFTGDPQVWTLLREHALNASLPEVRATAVKALIKFYGGEQRTLSLLQNHAVNDRDEKVREAATKALTANAQDGIDLLS